MYSVIIIISGVAAKGGQQCLRDQNPGERAQQPDGECAWE